MNIALFASRSWSIVWIPALLSFPTTCFPTVAVAQNSYSDQLPPAPVMDSYGAPINSAPTTTYTVANPAGYRVIIPGENPSLLLQARAIEPTAFLQTLNGQRVIQVGVYRNETIARQQVARFQSQGIPVILQATGATSSVPMAANPVPNSNPLSPTLPIVQTSAKGYYVIIPTSPATVNAVQSQLSQLGIPQQYIFLRDRPFGIHYAIGVFSQRDQADKMATLVRDRAKLDSRVHYEH